MNVPEIKVTALCGSRRPGSFTRKALAVAAEGATRAGGTVSWVDLAELDLPLFDDSPKTREHPETMKLKAAIQSADALLVATPVYHDSLSGSLKNAFDLLYDELMDKLAALIAVGGGRVGQGQALEHLRAILRETSAWVLPRQVAVGQSKEAFDEDGRPKEKELEQRLTALGQELVVRARILRPRRRG
jgi:FMN reductase